MSLPLGYCEERDEYAERVCERPIRILPIGERDVTEEGYINRPREPLEAIDESFSWQIIDKNNCLACSALAVITLCELARRVDYPVGAITTALGGISIDSLLPMDSVTRDGPIKEFLISSGKYIADLGQYNSFGPANYTQQAGVFNEKIAPLRGLAFRGVLFYQGENSAATFESGRYFAKALEELIRSYRSYFEDEQLPFVISGIAPEFYPYGDSYGLNYIQEALGQMHLHDCYFAPIYDIEPRWLILDGNRIDHPIHTVYKKEAGLRYAKLIEESIIRGTPFFYPYVKKTKQDGGRLLLKIALCGEGFEIGKEYPGFQVAGEDDTYRLARAVALDKDTLALSSREVSKPCYYCYGFGPYSYLDACKTIEGYPLVESRSKVEPFATSHYICNAVVASCDRLEVMESNFGPTVGGGFLTKLFSPGEIIHGRVELSLDEEDKTVGRASLRITAFPKNDSYYYFGVKTLLSPCGAPSRLEEYPYLTLSLKGYDGILFEGALFRLGQRIYKWQPVDGDGALRNEIPLSAGWEDYSLSLTRKLDGSEAPYPMSKDELRFVSYAEFYFRSEEEGECVVHMDDIRGMWNPAPHVMQCEEAKRDFDATMLLPKGE